MPRHLPPARAALAAALAALSLAGCTSMAGPAPAADPTMTDPAMAEPMPVMPSAEAVKAGVTCGADRLPAWLGTTMTDAAEAQLRAWRGDHAVRVLGPGMAATMDYRPDRLNVDVDAARRVTRLRCG